MPVPSPAALSRQLDPLTYAARHQLLAMLGRDHAGSAELEKLLDALTTGDLFAQTCALMIARHAGHVATIEAALRSDVPDLWTFAVASIRAVDIPAEVVVERCLDGPLRLRRLLVARVLEDHRTDLAEQLLPALRARYGTRAAAPLLAATTSETVTALLAEFDFALTQWSYLVRWHEAATFEHIAGRLRAVPDSTQEWIRYAKALAYLIRKRPLAVLALCTETAPRSVPSVIQDSLGFLARHHPRETVDLLLSDEYVDLLRSSGIPRNLLPAISEMPEAEQERLITRVGNLGGTRRPQGAQLALSSAAYRRRVAPNSLPLRVPTSTPARWCGARNSSRCCHTRFARTRSDGCERCRRSVSDRSSTQLSAHMRTSTRPERSSPTRSLSRTPDCGQRRIEI